MAKGKANDGDDDDDDDDDASDGEGRIVVAVFERNVATEIRRADVRCED